MESKVLLSGQNDSVPANLRSCVKPRIATCSQKTRFNGLLAVNKPIGMVSKDVSRWLTKRLGKVKLGHVGTLDPLAEGVLPILFGTATRLQDYLLESPKVYECVCQLGKETDTLDSEGRVVRELPWDHIVSEDVYAAATFFQGEIEQVPPIYSAIKYKGRPLYQYARSGEQHLVDLEKLKRSVNIYQFEIMETDLELGTIKIRVSCSKGTYIRVLVKDLSERLGTCGNMIALRRIRSSGIDLSETYGLEEIEEKIDDFASMLVSIEGVDLALVKWTAQESHSVERLRAGQPLIMKTPDFLRSIASGEKVDVSATASSIMLLDEMGRAFGIGSIRSNPVGVNITMKRGLL